MFTTANLVAALVGATAASASSVLHPRSPHPHLDQVTGLGSGPDGPVLALALDVPAGPLFVGPVTAEADVELYLAVEELKVDVDVGVSIGVDFLTKPVLEISLAGLEIETVVDLYASAKLSTFIELKVLEAVDIAIPGLVSVDLKTALALDLMVSVSAMIDAQVGVFISFGEEATATVDLVTLAVSLNAPGIVARAVPLTIGVEVDLAICVDVELALRARIAAGIDADVDLLGLADIGAGLYVGVWLNIADLSLKICIGTGGSCPIDVEVFLAIEAAVIVLLDVDVSGVLSLAIAPSVYVQLATVSLEIGCPTTGTLPWGPGSGPSGPDTPAVGDNSTSTSSGGQTKPTLSSSLGGDSKPTSSHSGHAKPTWSGSGPVVTSPSGPSTTYTYTYTITTCGASAHHCPSSLTTVLVHTTSTVCPYGGDHTSAPYIPTSSLATATVTPVPEPIPTTDIWTTPAVTGPQTVTVGAGAASTQVWSASQGPVAGGAAGWPSPSGGASAPWSKPVGASPSGSWSKPSGGAVPSGYVNGTAPWSTGAPAAPPSSSWTYIPTSAVPEVSKPTETVVTAGAASVRSMGAGAVALIAAAMML